jgi:ectoine hydroxylase-related dioxygenase (phytanoyl-CoA dioxygenase family)
MAESSAVKTSTEDGAAGDVGALRRSLESLGVQASLLTKEQDQELDERGYIILHDLLGDDQVAALSGRFDELVAEEGDRAGIEVHQEAGTARLANLVNKGAVFDVCWSHPRLLATVAYIYDWRPFKLNSLNARAALPGQGHQRLHADSNPPEVPGVYQNCNSIWMLDDFTERNGATRIVPGSHLWGKLPGDVMSDPTEPHPDEILLLGRAGTLAIFNAHLWHGGTKNTTDKLRRSVMGGFVPREAVQQTVQRDSLSAATLSRLSEAQKYLLEV